MLDSNKVLLAKKELVFNPYQREEAKEDNPRTRKRRLERRHKLFEASSWKKVSSKIQKLVTAERTFPQQAYVG